jgi:hypothetical protein
MPMIRSETSLPVVKCGTKRVHRLEIMTLQCEATNHLFTDAMMSGSGCEAKM